MTNFVLVHGLGLGGWCWRRVAERLAQQGHRVLAPTLTGLGERSHLAHPGINLDTHITDVLNVLRWEELHDVILVGHSYGGSVVTGAADRATERIRKLIYLDAFVLRDGESVMDLQPPARADYYEQVLREVGFGWLVPPNPPQFYGVTDEREIAWMVELGVPQPVGTFRQPIVLVHEKPPFPRVYIWASNFTPSPFMQFAERYRDDTDWEYREIPAGHMVMLSHAAELSDMLLELAET